MLRIIGCVTQEHDLTLVAVALLVCVLATNTSMRLLSHGAHRHNDHRAIWIGVAALAFSCGVWTTHFLGMLAFTPGFPTAIDVPIGLSSLTLIAVPAQLGFGIMAHHLRRPHPRWTDTWGTAIAAGLLISAGIAMMHFVGMGAMQMSALIHYDWFLVAASVGMGVLLSVTAVYSLDRTRVTAAALLLTLAVGAVHFGAIGAMTLEPVGGMEVLPRHVSKLNLAIATGGGCVMILALAVLAFQLDRLVSARLATEATRFRALADATFEGLIFERAGRIVDANRAMYRLLGTDAPTLVGRPVEAVISGGVSLRPPGGERPTEYELILQDGSSRPVEVLWRTGPDPDGHVLAIRDISREKSAEQQIQQLVHFDVLTGLGNRLLLEQTLQKILALPERANPGVALLCVGLDRFKSINDTLGTRVGDAILIQAARRLRALVRDTDTVARVSGDEFAVIQPSPGSQASGAAAALAEAIVSELAEPYQVEGQTISIGGSVGVALFPIDGTSTLSLMTSGALALNRAKRDGRNTWRYCEPGMDELMRQRRTLESDLRVALVERQLRLAYQPFFHVATQEIAGYEALLRWDHPSRGRISPADFIPIAEECGLIATIGQWVLQTACAEAASWDRPLVIAVNLSPAQFGQDIAATVADVLHKTGLPPSLLELEITEGVLIGDTQNALQTLAELKALGVTLAMDDFGTGYSSLSYLKKFPFDKLKIDRTFIRDLDDDADGEPIVHAIIALSRSLRLEVTAEGVETARQLALLQDAGCTFAQGFLLGRPMDAHQIGRHDLPPVRIQPDEVSIRSDAKLIPLVHLGITAAVGQAEKLARQQDELERRQSARSA